MKKYIEKYGFLMKFLPSAVLFIAVWIVYSNSLHNTFLWDDNGWITENAYIKDWSNFLNFFSGNIFEGAKLPGVYWRPFSLIIFSIQWHVFHEWVVGYHAVNIFIHAANAILFYYLFLTLFKRKIPAFLAALVFAVHPLNIEAVTYISGISDPLMTFFILLGTLAFIKAERSKEKSRLYYLLCAFSLFMGILSKESAIVMPGILLIVALYERWEKLSFRKNLWESFKKTLPFFVVVAAYILTRLTVLDLGRRYGDNPLDLPLFEKIMTFFQAFLIYLRLLVAPLHLHMEWALRASKSLLEPDTALGGIALVAMVGIIIACFRKKPEVSFGLAWFLIALSPNTNILFSTVALLSEHWLYLALPGIFFALFFFFEEKICNKKYQIVFVFILAMWIGWISFLTIERNKEWKDPITFFEQTLVESPGSIRAMINLADAYVRRGETEKAFFYYDKAVSLWPNYSLVYEMRAMGYKKINEDDKAREDLSRSAELNPIGSGAKLITNYYMENKDYAKAHTLLEKMLLSDDTDLINRQRICIMIIQNADNAGDKITSKKYSEKLDVYSREVMNDPVVSFGIKIDELLSKFGI